MTSLDNSKKTVLTILYQSGAKGDPNDPRPAIREAEGLSDYLVSVLNGLRWKMQKGVHTNLDHLLWREVERTLFKLRQERAEIPKEPRDTLDYLVSLLAEELDDVAWKEVERTFCRLRQERAASPEKLQKDPLNHLISLLTEELDDVAWKRAEHEIRRLRVSWKVFQDS